MNLFNMNFGIDEVLQIFTKIIIIFLVLPIHEYAHAWMAHKMGDDTAGYMGRLTLNPLAHIDWIGAICLLFTGFGWAKPVPINPNKFRKQRLGVSLTAAAGPASNLIVSFIALVVYRIILATSYFRDGIADLYSKYINIDYCLSQPLMGSVLEREANGMSMLFFILYILEVFIIINIGLAIFNLIPIPPLDGSKIVGYFTSAKFDQWINRNGFLINIIFMVVILSGVLSTPLGYIGGWVQKFFWFITGFIPKIFGV